MTARQLADSEPMIRKNLFLPRDLIERTESLAERQGASFAEIVRRALARYEPEGDEQAVVESLIDRVLETHAETVARLDRLQRQLDRTHAQLEAHRHGVD